MFLDQLVPVLQLSIGPVILISGGGLVLLSMTNRFGRVIDRSRILAKSIRESAHTEADNLNSQLAILIRRAELLRIAILCTSFCLLLTAILIIALFLIQLLSINSAALIIFLFMSGILSLIIGLIYFIVDINVSLTALKVHTGVEKRETEIE